MSDTAMTMDRLKSELARMEIAYRTGLSRDVEPISKEAVAEGIELLQHREQLTASLTRQIEATISAIRFIESDLRKGNDLP